MATPPDFLPTTATASATTLRQDQSLTFTYTVSETTNAGGGSIANVLYFADNPNFTNPLQVATDTASLGPGGSKTVTVTFDDLARFEPGTYYAYVYADFYQNVFETDEFNNVSAPTQFTIIDGLPDYVIDAPTNPLDRPIYTDEEFRIDAIVRELNGFAGTSVQTALYINSVDDFAGATLLTEQYPSLSDTGIGYSRLTTYDISEYAAGDYYLFAVADDAGNMVESDETNNVSDSLQVTFLDGRPDLALSDLQAVGGTTFLPGESVILNATVSELNGARDRTEYFTGEIAYTISTNIDGIGGELLGSGSFGLYPGSQWVTSSPSLDLTGYAPGEYYLFAVADPLDNVAETDEEVNNTSAPLQITILDDRPDLEVANLRNLTTNVLTDDTGSTYLAVDVRETAGFDVGFFEVKFYYNTEDTLTGATAFSTKTPLLGAFEQTTVTAFIDGNNFEPDEYYFFAVVDGGGVVDEIDETNNATASPGLKLEIYDANADFTVTDLNAVGGTTVRKDDPFMVTATVQDLGLGFGQSTYTRFFINDENSFEGATDLGEKYTDLYGESEATVRSPVLDLSGYAPGTYYIFAKADADDFYEELDETNNVSTGLQITITPAYIEGTTQDDRLAGTDGDDWFRPLTGSDFVNGGLGMDSALLTGLSLGRTDVFEYDGYIYSLDKADGSFTELQDIETITDGVTTLQTSAVAAFDSARYIASYDDLAAVYGLNTQLGTQHYALYGFGEGREVTFDAAQYVSNYLDLAIFTGNTAMATQHYITDGAREGRLAEDPLDYIASHADLIGAFGHLDAVSMRAAGIAHYEDFGAAEGRRTAIDFDVEAYLGNHADLATVFGTDTQAATFHYIEYGFEEGRLADDVYGYIASNTDLTTVFGDLDTASLAQAGLQHYTEYGRFEGRATDTFDAEMYLSNYSDLRAAFGDGAGNYDLQAATFHYIEFGFDEGRTDDLVSL